MRVAIHQPNFLPWLGIFHRMALVDKFIFLDHVQAPRGKSWISRNRILLDGQARWLTIPTFRSGRSLQSIAAVSINYGSDFTRKHLGTFRQAYGKCDHFEETFSFLEALYRRRHEFLCGFNREYLQGLAGKLGLKTEYVSSSDMVRENKGLANLSGNDLVLQLCLQSDADKYISGSGCLDFIDPDSFRNRGIDFVFQEFLPPPYRQADARQFVPALSSVDALFNVGIAGMRGILPVGGKLSADAGEGRKAADATSGRT